jgi:predicted Zn-dependent protease
MVRYKKGELIMTQDKIKEAQEQINANLKEIKDKMVSVDKLADRHEILNKDIEQNLNRIKYKVYGI